MKRDRIHIGPILMAGLATTLVAAAVTVWALVIRPPVLRSYTRLQLGMTRGDVEAVIGLPPGFYDGIGPMPISMAAIGDIEREHGLPWDFLDDWRALAGDGPNKVAIDQWVWTDYWIRVAYDQDGKAVGCYLFKSYGSYGYPPTFLDRLRRVFGY